MTAPRLTFPSYDRGAADILAGGEQVGICLDEGGGRWRSYLYKGAQDGRIRTQVICEEVTARTLGELRRLLRDRVAAEGPWWA